MQYQYQYQYHGGPGNNIPCDLHNEYLNKLFKEIIAKWDLSSLFRDQHDQYQHYMTLLKHLTESRTHQSLQLPTQLRVMMMCVEWFRKKCWH